MPIETLPGFTANISMETQIQQNRRYTTIQLDIIHTGDCLEILKTLPGDSIHCCVTSPPYYALRDYGMEAQIGRETTPKEYISRLTEVFTEVRRVLRPDGTLWLNTRTPTPERAIRVILLTRRTPTAETVRLWLSTTRLRAASRRT